MAEKNILEKKIIFRSKRSTVKGNVSKNFVSKKFFFCAPAKFESVFLALSNGGTLAV